MSSICELSDDLLVKILSLVDTRYAVATSLLSKRWHSVWKLVPRLDYGTPLFATGSDFVNNFLLLSKAPVLETMHLRLGENCVYEEHERWVDIAVARHVRHLELFHYRFHLFPMPCPKSLFTCKGLVVLRLQQVMIWDIPSTMFLQSLKTLSLLCVRFLSGDELVHSLLSACPILETLIVRTWLSDHVTTFTIAVPSLQSLCIMKRPDFHGIRDGSELGCTETANHWRFTYPSRFRNGDGMGTAPGRHGDVSHELGTVAVVGDATWTAWGRFPSIYPFFFLFFFKQIVNNLRLLSRNSEQYENEKTKMWDVGGDDFDSMEDVGVLELAHLSLDEPDLENELLKD